MTTENTSSPSIETQTALAVINEALPAIYGGLQVICDLGTILYAISKGAEEEFAMLAKIGLRIAEGDLVEELSFSHSKLRSRLSALPDAELGDCDEYELLSKYL